MTRFALLWSLLLLLSSGAFGQGVTWLVDDSCPEADFASLQQAIDAAADGDTIFVRAGSGAGHSPVVVSAKSLVVIGLDAPVLGDAQTTRRIQVRDLAAHQSVVLRGFDSLDPLRVRDCAGPVWVEDCRFEASFDSARAGAEIVDCAAVTLTDCELRGADGAPQSLLGPHESGHGLLVSSSRVYVYGSELRGGQGGDANFAGPSGGAGGDGVRVLGAGFLLLNNASTWGGDGGAAAGLVCSKAGAPGHGVNMATLLSAFWYTHTGFNAGHSGPVLLCPTSVGQSIAGPGLINTHYLVGLRRVLHSADIVANGGELLLTLDAWPGDTGFLYFSLLHEPVALAGFDGALLPGLGGVLIPLGTLSASQTQLSLPIAPGSVPPDMALSLYLQLLVDDSGDKRAASGSCLTVIDENVASALGCGD